MTDYVKVGEIVNTHGIKGEVRVINVTDFPDQRFAVGNTLYLEEAGDRYLPLVVTSHRVHKKFDLLTFESYTNINEVLDWVGHDLFIAEDQQSSLEEDSFYIHEIIGLDVVDEKNNSIGQIKEVQTMPSNDVWVVKREHKKDLLLPIIKNVIKSVDLEAGRVVVCIPEGLETHEN